MNESSISQTSISKSKNISEVADFWDEHDLDEYWEGTEEVAFRVRALRRHRVTLASEIYEQIEEKARVSGLLPETLVNIWLAERLSKEKAA